MDASSKSPTPAIRGYRFGIYEADIRTGELTRDGVKVKLQEQPFQILLVLLERAPDLVTRQELQQRLWPADTFVDFERGLNAAINKLRNALRDSADNPRFIQTLPGRGYRFIAPRQEIAHATVTPQPSTVPVAPLSPPADVPQPSSRGIIRTLLALIQIMYLCFYIVALARLGEVEAISERFVAGHGWVLLVAVLVTAVLGIPVRLFLLSAVIFDHPQTGKKFLRIFAFVLALDIVWALAPFLLTDDIGIGLAFAAMACLLYLPFSQRTLIKMTYPQS